MKPFVIKEKDVLVQQLDFKADGMPIAHNSELFGKLVGAEFVVPLDPANANGIVATCATVLVTTSSANTPEGNIQIAFYHVMGNSVSLAPITDTPALIWRKTGTIFRE